MRQSYWSPNGGSYSGYQLGAIHQGRPAKIWISRPPSTFGLFVWNGSKVFNRGRTNCLFSQILMQLPLRLTSAPPSPWNDTMYVTSPQHIWKHLHPAHFLFIILVEDQVPKKIFPRIFEKSPEVRFTITQSINHLGIHKLFPHVMTLFIQWLFFVKNQCQKPLFLKDLRKKFNKN